MDAEEFADRGEGVVAEVRVGERRAREPRLGRRQGGRPEERVQEREVHRLLAREDLGTRGAEREEEEERSPRDELRLPPLGRRRREGPAARESPGGGAEGRRPRQEQRPPERRPAPGHEEPGPEREEEDAARLPERVEAGAFRQGGGEEGVAGEAEKLEEAGEEEERGGPGSQAGQARAGAGFRHGARGGRGLGEEEVVARERARRRAREEPRLDLARRELPAVLEDEDLRVVVHAQGLVRELVRELEAEERRPRREGTREREPEVPGEQEAERAVRERELVRSPRHGPVEPLRLEDDAVRGRQLLRELRHLRGRVRLVEPEHHDRVPLGGGAGEREREALVPVLLEDAGSRGDVLVEPPGSRDRAVRARVDREEGERPDGGARGDGGPEDPTGAGRRGLLGQPRGRPEREDRVDGQEVAGELHRERAGDEDVRHEERRQHPLAGPEPAEGREPRARRPKRREPEQGPERPEDELLALVEKVRDADVLVRVRQEARVADHRALLGQRAPKLLEVEERVRLAQSEPGEGRGEREGREGGAAAPAPRGGDGQEGRESEGQQERRRARLRREREAGGPAGEEGVARASAVRQPRTARARARRTMNVSATSVAAK